MDTFYAFLIFALLLVVDLFAQQRWLALYYRLGLPVFFVRAPAAKNNPLRPAQWTQETARDLEARFRGRPAHPSIQFRLLPGGALAFRERLFENRGGFKYLPVIHSTARLHPQRGQVTVTGYLNLWVIFTLGYILYRSTVEAGFLPVALLALLVLALSFAAQAGINRQVARDLSGEAGGVEA